MRASRGAGSRRIDPAPRLAIVPMNPERGGCSAAARRTIERRAPHGRLRSRSARNWRRSSTTVRKSWAVAANRSWDTRRAAELESLAAKTSAGGDRCCADRDGDDDGEDVDPHVAGSPTRRCCGQGWPARRAATRGRPRTTSAMRPGPASRGALSPAIVASQQAEGGRRGRAPPSPDVQRTHEHTEQHAARRPGRPRAGSSVATSCPAMPQPSASTNAAERRRCSHG